LRTLEPEDSAWLVKWLSDPVVLEFYEGRDRPHDLNLVKQHFYEDGEEITRCVIQYQEKPIGYLQFYIVDDEELEKYGLNRANGLVFGMDQFIGESVYWNQGIGTCVIRETVRYLVHFRNAKKIVMDPQAWNERALRAYEKAGFAKKKYLEKHEWHEGEYRDCWLIEYEASAAREGKQE